MAVGAYLRNAPPWQQPCGDCAALSRNQHHTVTVFVEPECYRHHPFFFWQVFFRCYCERRESLNANLKYLYFLE